MDKSNLKLETATKERTKVSYNELRQCKQTVSIISILTVITVMYRT